MDGEREARRSKTVGRLGLGEKEGMQQKVRSLARPGGGHPVTLRQNGSGRRDPISNTLGHWQEEVSEGLVLCEEGDEGRGAVRPSVGPLICSGNRRAVEGWASRSLKIVL